MHRIDNATAATSLPTPAAAGTPGYWTAGNPGAGTPATVMDPDWFNDLQEEMISLLTAGGVTPDKTNHGQILATLRKLFSGSAGEAEQNVVPTSGGVYQKSLTFTPQVNGILLACSFVNFAGAQPVTCVNSILINGAELASDTTNTTVINFATLSAVAGTAYTITSKWSAGVAASGWQQVGQGVSYIFTPAP